jgi:hypothetical protein
MINIDEYEVEELKAQDRFERNYSRALLRNPNCRDPDHPGCDMCEEDEDDTNTKTALCSA